MTSQLQILLFLCRCSSYVASYRLKNFCHLCGATFCAMIILHLGSVSTFTNDPSPVLAQLIFSIYLKHSQTKHFVCAIIACKLYFYLFWLLISFSRHCFFSFCSFMCFYYCLGIEICSCMFDTITEISCVCLVHIPLQYRINLCLLI